MMRITASAIAVAAAGNLRSLAAVTCPKELRDDMSAPGADHEKVCAGVTKSRSLLQQAKGFMAFMSDSMVNEQIQSHCRKENTGINCSLLNKQNAEVCLEFGHKVCSGAAPVEPRVLDEVDVCPEEAKAQFWTQAASRGGKHSKCPTLDEDEEIFLRHPKRTCRDWLADSDKFSMVNSDAACKAVNHRNARACMRAAKDACARVCPFAVANAFKTSNDAAKLGCLASTFTALTGNTHNVDLATAKQMCNGLSAAVQKNGYCNLLTEENLPQCMKAHQAACAATR